MNKGSVKQDNLQEELFAEMVRNHKNVYSFAGIQGLSQACLWGKKSNNLDVQYSAIGPIVISADVRTVMIAMKDHVFKQFLVGYKILLIE